MVSALDDLPWQQQLLDQPYGEGLIALLEAVAGLNAQTAFGPLVGIYARTGPWNTATLDDLRASYRVVKINVMRGTVHLLTARQYWAWRPALGPLLRRNVTRYFPGVWERVNHDALLSWGTDFVSDGRHVTRGDLGAAASQHFPGSSRDELGFALRMLLPLVEVAPGTAWQHPRTHYVYAPSVMPESSVPSDVGLQDLADSFAAAFHTNSAADFRYWSGLTKSETAGIRKASIADAEQPGSTTPPSIVLPEFDNMYFCRQDSAAPLYAAKKDPRLPPARLPGTLIAAGKVVGHWTAKRADGPQLEPWTKLPPAVITIWEEFKDWYLRANV